MHFGPEQPFDLGCHWMHSASLNPFVGIADRLGFRYSHERGWDGPIHHHGAFLDDNRMSDVDALVAADERAIAAAARNGDPAVADVVNADSPWAPYHAYWLTLDWSRDPDQFGVADVVAYSETNEDWPVVDGCLLHLSRRIPDRAARRGRDRGRAEWTRRGRVTANHPLPTTRGRRTDHVRSTTDAAPVAIRGLFTSADSCGRAPAGTPAAKQIFLAEVRPNLYTDIRDT